MTIKSGVCVIGIGSHHAADATGWVACEMLQAQCIASRIDWQLCRNPMQLPQLVGDYDAVVILDAVISDKPSGQVLPMLWPIQQDTYPSPCSSHGLGVVAALQLASTLGQLPVPTYILGICINARQQNAAPVVTQALPQLRQELERIQKTVAS